MPSRSPAGTERSCRSALHWTAATQEALAFVAQPRDLQAADIRQLMSGAVEGRFEALTAEPCVQWLSANGSIYTALETVIQAERLGLEVVTTPVRSPESNGMSEAFVNTIRRDYNEVAPHSALKMKSPREFRAGQTHPPLSRCPTNKGIEHAATAHPVHFVPNVLAPGSGHACST